MDKNNQFPNVEDLTPKQKELVSRFVNFLQDYSKLFREEEIDFVINCSCFNGIEVRENEEGDPVRGVSVAGAHVVAGHNTGVLLQMLESLVNNLTTSQQDIIARALGARLGLSPETLERISKRLREDK